MSKLPIILNPRSGRGAEKEADALRAAFQAAGTEPEIHVVEGDKIYDVVRGIVAAGMPVIGVAGGDGTLSSAARAIAGTTTALLPIPLGTFNHFAQRYGVPTVQAAAHAWQKHSAHSVPIGYLNDLVFLNNASCGFYPHLVRQRDRIERILPHGVAGWLAGTLVLSRLQLMSLKLEVEGESRRFKTPALWVGLGEGSLRLPTPGDAHRDSDLLEVVTPIAQRRIALIALMLRTMVRLKRGRETPADRALDVLHTRSFTLDSHHRIDVGLDGEPHRFRPPLHFRYEPAALKVLCLVAP